MWCKLAAQEDSHQSHEDYTCYGSHRATHVPSTRESIDGPQDGPPSRPRAGAVTWSQLPLAIDPSTVTIEAKDQEQLHLLRLWEQCDEAMYTREALEARYANRSHGGVWKLLNMWWEAAMASNSGKYLMPKVAYVAAYVRVFARRRFLSRRRCHRRCPRRGVNRVRSIQACAHSRRCTRARAMEPTADHIEDRRKKI